jgi:outer membrane biosynthesis protein TonB
MSDSSSGDPHETASVDGPGILAGLPRTRPQRPSARRAASRTAKPEKRPLTHERRSKPAGETMPVRKPTDETVPKRKPTSESVPKRKPTSESVPKRKPTGESVPKRKPTGESVPKRKPTGETMPVRKPTDESVPKQGYEPEGDSLNRPIQPPGGAELVASLAELAGELAKAGVGTGGRMLRDFLSHLPG